MNTFPTSSEKNLATLIHLSSLAQYIFPFGNFIFPAILWSAKKNDSEYINSNGKNVINFQLSLFMYSLLLLLIIIPIIVFVVFQNIANEELYNTSLTLMNEITIGKVSGIVLLAIVALLVFCFMKFIEFILIIYASIKSLSGDSFKYPLTIKFLK
jgi:uncharacterized Tic20 family protein